MRNVYIQFVEKIKTHILYSVTFFRKSCCLWDSAEKRGRAREAASDNTVWRICVACWISKASRAQTHVHPYSPGHRLTHCTEMCNTYCFTTATIVIRTRLIVTLYVHWHVLFLQILITHAQCSTVTCYSDSGSSVPSIIEYTNWILRR